MAKTERGTREEEGNGESSEKHWVIFLGYVQVAVAQHDPTTGCDMNYILVLKGYLSRIPRLHMNNLQAT